MIGRYCRRATNPSVAIGLLANMSGDQSRNNRADGLVEEIITVLSAVSQVAAPRSLPKESVSTV
jgi:TolB-like protein